MRLPDTTGSAILHSYFVGQSQSAWIFPFDGSTIYSLAAPKTATRRFPAFSKKTGAA